MADDKLNNSLIKAVPLTISRYSSSIVKRGLLDLQKGSFLTTKQSGQRLIVAGSGGWSSMTCEDLRRESYEVTQVKTLGELLTLLSQNQYDMALLTNDNISKGEGMPEIVSEIKERFPRVSVIVVSGYASLSIAIDYQKRGVDDFVAVPFDLVDLIKIIRRVLASRNDV